MVVNCSVESLSIQGKQIKKRTLYFLSFAVPFVLLLFLYFILDIAPFGNNTLVLADAKGQYISYFSFYRRLLLGQCDHFYSFSKILGGPTVGLFAYYLASPLNLLFLLFPPEKLPLAIDWLIVIKLSLCGFTTALFFNERKTLRPCSLILTTAYAFCGYNIAYAWCILWLDAVIILPLICLGLERLLCKSEPSIYILSLSVGIISCFYTGYMLCIFSVLYFLFLIVEKWASFQRRSVFLFCFSSLIAGGLSAFILLPGYMALSGGVPKGFYNAISKFTYPAMTILLNYFFPSFKTYDSFIIPALIFVCLLYSFILFYTTYLFLARKGTRTLRISLLCLSIALLTAWYFFVELPVHKEVGYSERHIFTKFIIGYTPFWEFFNGSPNVYTGSLSFMLALSFFTNRKIPGRQRIAGALLLTIMICSVCFNVINVIWHGFEQNNCFNYRYSFVICFVIILISNSSLKNVSGISCTAVLYTAFFCFAILFCNIPHPIWFFNNRLFAISALFLLCSTLAFLLYLKNEKKNAIYVVLVELCAITLTIGLSFNNQTDDQAASAEHFSNVMIYGQEAINNIRQSDPDFYRIRKQSQYNYNDPLLFGYPGLSHYSSSEKTATINFLSALGQQTLSPYWANGDLGESRALDSLLGVRYYIGDPIEGYETSFENIQKNPNALSLSFVASQAALNAPELSGNVASNINTVFSYLCGEKIQIFTVADSTNGKLTVSDNNMLYFCIDNPLFDGYELYRNGEPVQQQFGLFGKRLITLGTFEVNDQLEIFLYDRSGDPLSIPLEDFYYYEDFSVISKAINRLNSIPVEENIKTDSQIELSVNPSEDAIVVLTLPDDKGWEISLDNQPTEHTVAFQTLIAIPITEGNHQIALCYHPPGLTAGLCISLFSLFVFFALIFFNHKRNSIH